VSLPSGSRLGPYDILALIGSGGMGEVYRAHDGRLGRDVAIKVLPATFSADPDRLRRFEQEARAAAALSHPNILHVLDIGTDDKTAYVVSELLEGQTLRALIDGGALPLSKAIDYARQIALGLAAAHAKSITHRDIKPENVFVLPDGRIKILDFGLAKVREDAPGGASTRMQNSTGAGVVLGTAGYMSPEQVRAQPVDARSDIFSAGVVLFEMVAGTRPFQGDSAVETMNAILKEDPPDLTLTNSRLPPAMNRIVRHCLEKAPGERFQSARDLAFALEALSGSGVASSPTIAAVPSRSRRSLIEIGAAIALVALAAAAARLLWPAPAATSWTGVRLGGPDIAMGPRMSPDGSTLAFIAMDGNMSQVAVMKPESGDWRILTQKRNAGYVVEVSWAPDGNKIYFDRTSDVPMGVFSVPVVGGDEQLVLEDAASPAALPDGSLLVVRLNAERRSRLFRFWPDTGRLQEFPIEPWAGGGSPNRAHVFEDGQEAVIVGTLVSDGQPGGKHLYVLELGSGRVRRLTTGFQDDSSIATVTVTRDGQSVLAVGTSGSLSRIVAIPRRGNAAPQTVLTLTMVVSALDVGPDGRIYADQNDNPMAVTRFPLQGGHAETVATLPDGLRGFAVLPDGRIVATQLPGGRPRLMVIETGKNPRPLITTHEDTTGPVTTAGPGGVAFLVGPEPRRTIALATVANGRITRRIPFEKGAIDSLASSPDGVTLYVAAGGTIWSVASSGGEPRRIRAGNSAAIDPAGEHLLVQVIETPRSRLFEMPLDGGPEREIPLNGPFHLTFEPLYSSSIGRDGRLLVPLASPDNWFFLPGVVDLATGRMTQIPVDHFGDYHFLVRAPNGQVIACAYDLRSALWRFQPEAR
jgi:eukaryotic-like serine/threonine-protein kinase